VNNTKLVLLQAKPAELQAALNQQFDSFRQQVMWPLSVSVLWPLTGWLTSLLFCQMTKDAKKANKMEKRLMTLTQGYEKRATQLITETQTMYEEYQQAQTDLQSFQRLEVEFGCELAGFLLRRGTANRIGGVLISVLVV